MNCEEDTKEKIMDENKRKQVICYGNGNTIGNYAEAHVRTRKKSSDSLDVEMNGKKDGNDKYRTYKEVLVSINDL